MLRFWAQDDEGAEVFSDSREYGFNFVDPGGNEPGMVDNVSGRGFNNILEPEVTRRESFAVPQPPGSQSVELRAALSYIFFVTPPPEAQNRMQQGIIRRIRSAETQEAKDRILNQEIPARMRSMNVLATTYPPVIMATASKTVPTEGQ